MTANTIEEYKPNLSPEHCAVIHFDGMYKADPDDFRSFYQSGSRYWDVTSKYHCRNWCFEPHVWRDGRVFMTDNYWGGCSESMSYELTDENFDEMFPKFECVMENRFEWTKISDDAARKYDPKDIVYDVANDSGGYTCSTTTWVRKDAKPAVAREISVAKGELLHETRSALDTWSLKRAIEKIDELLVQAADEGVDYTENALKAELEETVEKFCGESVRFGDVHDMDDYLAERCYRRGEVYSTNGFTYTIYEPDFEVRQIGEAIEVDDGNSVECYFHAGKEEIVELLIDKDGKVLDTVRFDSTPHNIAECASGKKPKEFKIDSFPITWNNFDVPEVIEKSKAVFEALDELRKTFS